jgi:hypothetical protein
MLVLVRISCTQRHGASRLVVVLPAGRILAQQQQAETRTCFHCVIDVKGSLDSAFDMPVASN